MGKKTKKNLIIYWVSTILLAIVFILGGINNLVRSDEAIKQITSLHYPIYLLTILGVAKLLAVIVILSPKLPILKEWAYAGLAIDLVGAFISHAIVDGLFVWGGVLPPLVILIITLLSYCYRPVDRKL